MMGVRYVATDYSLTTQLAIFLTGLVGVVITAVGIYDAVEVQWLVDEPLIGNAFFGR